LLRETFEPWSELQVVAVPQGDDTYCSEAQTLKLLEAHGIPVVKHRLCQTAAQVREAFVSIGGPVVIKACSAEVPHKSDFGLVALGVQNGEIAATIFESQRKKLTEMNVSHEGIIVAAMTRGRHECMVGARHDPVFGPVVMVGAGGKYVEALKDYAVLLPPFDTQQVEKALRGLRMAPLLDGLRGDAAMDVTALAQIAVSVGRLMVAAGPSIASLDLNPVMVGAVGEGAIVVDALLERGLHS
jgi:acyl-CoA synthetase (NDP forming)